MEFKTWNAYDKFAYTVKYLNRNIFSEDLKDFLETLYATSERRLKTIAEGEYLYRSQLGCDFVDKKINGETIHGVEFPFGKMRMLPRSRQAREGRANSKGIPVLYTSDNKNTALAEARPWLGSIISLAYLEVKKELRIVNFCSDFKKSFYYFEEPDPETREKIIWKQIDTAFSQPNIMSEDTSEYAATQVIAEFLKYKGYDGIAYRSSFDKGLNYALFDIDSVEVLHVDLQEPEEIRFTFKENAFPY